MRTSWEMYTPYAGPDGILEERYYNSYPVCRIMRLNISHFLWLLVYLGTTVLFHTQLAGVHEDIYQLSLPEIKNLFANTKFVLSGFSCSCIHKKK